jgi:hypothetical protein
MALHRPVTSVDVADLDSMTSTIKPISGEMHHPEKQLVADLRSAADQNKGITEAEDPVTVKEVLDKHHPTKQEASNLQSRASFIAKETSREPVTSTILSNIQSHADRYGDGNDKSGESTEAEASDAHSSVVQTYGGDVPQDSGTSEM